LGNEATRIPADLLMTGHVQSAPRSTLEIQSMRILARRLTNGSQWVFPSPRRPGMPVARLNSQHDALMFRLDHVKDQEKWVEKPPEKKIQFVLYDLRHTYATRLAQLGVAVPTIAALLGHSGLRVVGRYVHPTEEHQQAATLRYEASLAEAKNEAQKRRASFGPVLI
jgi:integrase